MLISMYNIASVLGLNEKYWPNMQAKKSTLQQLVGGFYVAKIVNKGRKQIIQLAFLSFGRGFQ